jgi:hypothetical protein
MDSTVGYTGDRPDVLGAEEGYERSRTAWDDDFEGTLVSSVEEGTLVEVLEVMVEWSSVQKP